jgi:hypothetical protein
MLLIFIKTEYLKKNHKILSVTYHLLTGLFNRVLENL